MNEENIFLELEGDADDLLMVNNDETMKCTRLIRLDPTSRDLDEEIVDICITSTNMTGGHPIFDRLLGRKIKILVEFLD